MREKFSVELTKEERQQLIKLINDQSADNEIAITKSADEAYYCSLMEDDLMLHVRWCNSKKLLGICQFESDDEQEQLLDDLESAASADKYTLTLEYELY